MTEFHPFRDKLHDHQMAAGDALWAKIESQLPEQPRRKPAPWFWITLMTGALIGGGLVYMAITTPWASPSTPANPAEEVRSHSATAANVLSGDSSSDTPAEGTAQQLIADAPANHTATQTTNRNINRAAGSDTPAPNLSALPASPQQPTTTASTGMATPAEASQALTGQQIVQPIPALSTRLTTSPPTVPKRRAPKFKTDIHCYKFSKGTGNLVWSADFYGGYGFSPRTLMDTGSESSLYAAARDATESYGYAWNAGARVNLHLRNGLTFRTGLDYAQVGDVFDYTDTLATQSTTRIDSFFAADGTFLYADTNRILVLGTLIKKIHNTYRYLDIPLLAGFEIPLNRSMLMVHAGPVFNLATSQEGEILDPALHPRSITAGAPNRLEAYKTNLGLSLYVGGGLLYPLSEQLSAMAEARLLYRLSPVSLDGYPLEERRHLVGLNLGLRYHFL